MSKLIEAIQSGKSPKGLKGFLRVQSDTHYGNRHGYIYIPIIVKGIEVDGSELKCKVTASGGLGEMNIEPHQFVNTIKDAEKEERRRDQHAAAKFAERKITRWSTVAGRRRELLKFLENLKPEQRKDYDQELVDMAYPSIEKVPQHDLNKLITVACKGAFGILSEDEIDD